MSRRNHVARDLRHQKPQQRTDSNRSGSSSAPQSSSPKATSVDASSQIADAVSAALEKKIHAIEAAVEILSSEPVARITDDSVAPAASVAEPRNEVELPDTEPQSTAAAVTVSSEPKPVLKKPEATKPSDGKSNPLHVILHAFREGLTDLKSSLRDELRTAIGELQSAQAAAATSQSEVLRTLTEVMFQTAAAPRDGSSANVEAALSGLEDRIVQRLSHWKSEAPSSLPASAAPEATQLTKTGLNVPTVKLKEAKSVVSRSWEQIRSEMMARGDFDQDAAKDDSETPEQLPELAPLSSDRHFRLPEQDPTLEVPPAIDLDKLSIDELRDAFRQRESFLSTLIARMRRQQESAQSMLTKEQLREMSEQLPEELEAQVRQTLKQMEDLARMGELELSLERARVARQVNQLEHTKQILEHNARQLGMALNPDGSIALNKNPVTRNSSSRRWLGKLGFGQ